MFGNAAAHNLADGPWGLQSNDIVERARLPALRECRGSGLCHSCGTQLLAAWRDARNPARDHRARDGITVKGPAR